MLTSLWCWRGVYLLQVCYERGHAPCMPQSKHWPPPRKQSKPPWPPPSCFRSTFLRVWRAGHSAAGRWWSATLIALTAATQAGRNI